jgi:assimilatory nitrate reductase catalytic subunit
MSRTGRVARLFSHVEEPRLSMTRADLERRGLADGDVARVSSRRSAFVVRVEASDELRVGQAFMPMHWGGRFMRGPGVNGVTSPAFDPHSRQPELKAAAVEVARVDLPHRIVAMRRPGGDAVFALCEALRPLLDAFDYATLTLAGRDDPLVVLRGYAAQPLPRDVLDALDRLLDLDRPDAVMRYVDASRRVEKAARFDQDRVSGVCLSGETAAAEWLKNMMAGGASMEAVRPWVLAPVSSPPRGSLDRGRIVCNCFDVAAAEIEADARAGQGLESIQAARRCGTSCGSCLPELKRIVASSRAAAPRAGARSGAESPLVATQEPT